MKSARRKVLATLAAAATVLCTGTALAQGAYPSKPITIVVAYPAGGDVDVLARMFAEKLAPRLKQSVVVENRTGAAGTIGELFNKSAGIKISQVPYRGLAPAIVDVIGGQVPVTYVTYGAVAQYVGNGSLVPLAVADLKRSPFAPNVPTLAELGYKDVEIGAWQALLGPKNMPADMVRTLNAHINEILKMPDVVARMATIAVTPAGGEPAALSKLIAADTGRYTKIVKEFGIQAD
ncbi:Tripartite tricarboxylate transporter family receptor [compost metagenome]